MKRASTFVAFLSGFALLALSCADDCSDGGCGGGSDGECASLAEGEWGISGDPRVDTVFRAALELRARVEENAQVTRDAIADLAEAFGVEIDPAAPLEESAAAVAGAVQAVVGDAVDYLAWGAGPCAADLPLAHAVAAGCYTHFGCDVNGACLPEAGAYPPVACEGTCVGACSGSCSGSCLVPVEDGECTGTCYGSCNLAVEAACDGDCYGTCDGQCYGPLSPYGDCMGPCAGDCGGICETIHGATCGGTCTGMCGVEGEAFCSGECRGSCDADCGGDCAGRPFAHCGEDCEHGSDCGALGGIMGWVGARATWVDYYAYWSADPEDDSVAIAELAYQMAALEDAARALIAANEELRALIDAGAYPVTVIDGISGLFEGILNADLAEYDIPECEVPCVISALEEAADILSAIGTETVALVEAQIEILSALES